MTPSQKLIDAAAEAYGAALVKGAANPYIPALEAAVTVALKAAVEVAKGGWPGERQLTTHGEQYSHGRTDAANAISSLIPAQEKTNDA
jgi:hypothetical protein